jgi:signal peptidase
MSKLKDAMKNEYVKSLILLAIVLGGIVTFWFGLRTYLRTDFPMLAVASGSMLPTLNIGDLIIVEGVSNASDVVADYDIGDIIVFYRPDYPNRLIVHRAVIKNDTGDRSYFKTKGDNNLGDYDPWDIPFDQIVGKVVYKVDHAGNIPLFVRTKEGIVLIIFLVIVLVILEFLVPSKEQKAKGTTEGIEKTKSLTNTNIVRRMFAKSNMKIFITIFLNALLLLGMLFALLGSVSIFQPGADPPQWVTLRGIYPTVEYYKEKHYNASVNHGFLSFQIDSWINGVKRSGIPTLDWVQLLFLFLVIINVAFILDFLKSRKNRQPVQVHELETTETSALYKA